MGPTTKYTLCSFCVLCLKHRVAKKGKTGLRGTGAAKNEEAEAVADRNRKGSVTCSGRKVKSQA